MSRFWLMGALVLLLAAPLAAQSGQTIPQRLAADAQGRFTTLITALKATGLDTTLDGAAPYTLLAPTDAAFRALSELLGKSREELLADQATLRRILQYHILPGRVFFRQFASGQSFATTLDGLSVTGGLENGLLTIGGAQVSEVDSVAANGVIQVLDRVLVPPDVLPTAHLRVADFAPDTPGLDVYVDGVLTLFQAFGFPMVTIWIEVPAGVRTIAFTPNGAPLDQAIIIPAAFTLRPNSWTTLAAVGSLKAGTLFPVLIQEDAAPIPSGEARITVLNALENGPPIDFSLNRGVFVTDLGFPFALGDNDGYFTFDHRAGSYDAAARTNNGDATLSVDLPKTQIDAGKHYFFAVAGTLDEPLLVVSADQR